MVKSKLSNKIFYDENNWIEEEDEGKKTTMFKINLKDVDVVIALGEISKKWKNYNVYYWPVYLIISEDDIKQIGIYEIPANEKDYYMDDDGDLNISYVPGPLLFKSVTKGYLKKLLKNKKLIQDYGEDDEEIKNNDEDEKDNEEIESSSKNIFQELKSEEDDDKEYAHLENDKKDKKIRNEWIQSSDHRPINIFFKNSYYDIQPNPGSGDCLFCTISQALKTIGIKLDISTMRKKLAETLTIEQFNNYKELYTSINNNYKQEILEYKKLVTEGKEKTKQYKKLKCDLQSGKYDHADVKPSDKKDIVDKCSDLKKTLISLSKEIKKKIKEVENSQKNKKDVEWLKDIENIQDLKSKIKTNEFWADENAISNLENIYNIKLIILTKNYYKDDLNKNRVLNCGTVIHENVIKNNKFKPKYYIIIEYDNELQHYELIKYKIDEKWYSIFRFHELPYSIKELIKDKCMNNSGKSIFNYIPKFKKYIGEKVIDK